MHASSLVPPISCVMVWQWQGGCVDTTVRFDRSPEGERA
jgi:hypothetical protein